MRLKAAGGRKSGGEEASQAVEAREVVPWYTCQGMVQVGRWSGVQMITW